MDAYGKIFYCPEENIYSSDSKSEFCRESRKESEQEGSEYNSQQVK